MFIITVLVIGYVILRLSKGVAEERIRGFSQISSMTAIVKFASNYEKAEQLMKRKQYLEARTLYLAALDNLNSIRKKDEMVRENIKVVNDNLKLLDKKLK